VSWLLSKIYDFSMAEVERACLDDWRTTLLSRAAGEVLEIGAGTGANLGRYGPDVERVVLTEPDPHMRKQLEPHLARESRPTKLVDAGAESLPFDDGAFDTVVSTLVMCSVGSVDQTLAEIRRVLRPGGQLLFIEHVAAPNNSKRRKWQGRIEPMWKRLFGNCHLTRRTDRHIEEAGFVFEQLISESLRKAAPLVRPSIRGCAIKR
jgi:ubiquinone/menaquinone biosynthesis C-methylase UbiE